MEDAAQTFGARLAWAPVGEADLALGAEGAVIGGGPHIATTAGIRDPGLVAWAPCYGIVKSKGLGVFPFDRRGADSGRGLRHW